MGGSTKSCGNCCNSSNSSGSWDNMIIIVCFGKAGDCQIDIGFVCMWNISGSMYVCIVYHGRVLVVSAGWDEQGPVVRRKGCVYMSKR